MNYPKRITTYIERLKEVPSTNDYLKKLCQEGKAREFHTVLAESQTAGKGQRGNSWESETGKNLTFSMVLYPTNLEIKDHFFLSILTAFSVFEALRFYTDGFSIKWPNDIYWNDKKIGGILIENEMEGKYITQSVIGIGLNINQEVFLSDAPNPVSLKQIVGTTIEREEVLNRIFKGLLGGYFMLESDPQKAISTLQTLYRQHLYRKNGQHLYRDAQGEFMAEIHNVETDGHIVLKDEQNTLRRYAFKEVTFVLP